MHHSPGFRSRSLLFFLLGAVFTTSCMPCGSSFHMSARHRLHTLAQQVTSNLQQDTITDNLIAGEWAEFTKGWKLPKDDPNHTLYEKVFKPPVDRKLVAEYEAAQAKNKNSKQTKQALIEQHQTVDHQYEPQIAVNNDLTRLRAYARSPDGSVADPAGNNYILDLHGRVRLAQFDVTLVQLPDTNKVCSSDYCDAVENPNGYHTPPVFRYRLTGETRTRDAAVWERGHIIGRELGGNNIDPLNFFPQHRRSNRDNSVWYRMERIAAAVKYHFISMESAYLPPPPHGAPALPSSWVTSGGPRPAGYDGTTPWPRGTCPLLAYISFNYDDLPPAISLRPRGGTYQLRTSKECWARLRADNPANNELARIFANSPNLVDAAASATSAVNPYNGDRFDGKMLEYNWVNNVDVCADPLPVLPGIVLAPVAGYHPCPGIT